MTGDRESVLADGTIDAMDTRALRVLRDHLTSADPPPSGMAERIKFAMTVHALEADVAEIVSGATGLACAGAGAGAGTRATAYDRTSTLTFGSDNLSIMVSWEEVGDGRVVVSGWTSVGGVEIELRERARTRTAVSDVQGRFEFEGVDRGLVHFIFRRDSEDGFAPVITPAVEL